MTNETRGELLGAIKGNELDRVKRILAEGATLSPVDSSGDTPLHAAAFMGRNEIAALLIQAGANVNAALTSRNDPGATPLHLAAMGGHVEVVKLLVRSGANVLAKLGGDKEQSTAQATPMHLAASHGQTVVITVLTESHADVNARDYFADTPLHYAVNQCKTDAIQELIRLGADVNAKDNYGRTPLSLASQSGWLAMDKILRAGKAAGVGATGDSPSRGRVFIGLGIATVVIIGAALAILPTPQEPNPPGSTVSADIPLVTSDRIDGDCAAAAGIDKYHCGFTDENTAWSGDEKDKLKPYHTRDRDLFLIPGLFLQPAVQERFKSEPPDKPRDLLKRFTAKCNLKILGKVGSVKIRFLASGTWGLPTEAEAATIVDCTVEG